MALLKKPVNFEANFSGLSFQFGGSVITGVLGRNKLEKKNAWNSEDELNHSESSEDSSEGD